MRFVKKHAKSVSRRTLSLLMSVLVFAGLFTGILGVLFTFAAQPTAVADLNTTTKVQNINLMPVELGTTDNPTRTTYGQDNDSTLSTVVVNQDGSTTYKMLDEYVNEDNDGNYNNWLTIHTQVGQKINLMENPYLTISWEASTRMNVQIGISLTTNQNKAKIDNQTSDASNRVLNLNANELAKEFSYTNFPKSSFSLYNMYSDRTDNVSDESKNDFPNWSSADLTINMYNYFQKYFNEKDVNDKWLPKFSDGDYITVEYVVCSLVSNNVGEALHDDAYVTFKEFSLGKVALHPENDLAPRVNGSVDLGYTNSSTDTRYKTGRSQRLDDDRYVFLNPSETEKAVFRWGVYRYVNVDELQSLLFDADYEHSGIDLQYADGYMPVEHKKKDFTMRFALMGYNATSSTDKNQDDGNSDSSTQIRGFNAYLDTMLDQYSETKDTTDVVKKYKNAVIDFADVCDNYSDVFHDASDSASDGYTNGSDTYTRVPTGFAATGFDGLVMIRDITLVLPPKSKLTINTFNFASENIYATAVTPDTVYPWIGENQTDPSPVEGTTVRSNDIKEGFKYEAFDWVTDTVPDVAQKIDLLQFSYDGIDYSSIGQAQSYNAIEEGFWRTKNNGSYFTSDQTSFRDFSFSHGDSVTVNRSKTQYLYYSYELSGEGAAFGVHLASDTDHYFLAADGKAIQSCSGLMKSDDFAKSDANKQKAYKSISSAAKARTGVIKLDSNITFNKIHIYLSGLDTTLRIRYLFIGGDSLDLSKISSDAEKIAVNGGDAFAWSTTNEAFNKATLGTGSDVKFVFANRVDFLSDMIDRAKIHAFVLRDRNDNKDQNLVGKSNATLRTDECIGYILDSNDYTWQNGSISVSDKPTLKILRNSDNSLNSIELTVKPDEEYVHVGSYASGTWDSTADFSLRATSDSDLDKFRYLYYSVDADPGMRWAILVTSYGDDALARTWLTDNDKFSCATPISNDSLNSNWYNESVANSNAKDSKWAMYTIPGSETGCIDLMNFSDLDWTKIDCVRLIAYKDPTLKTLDGNTSESGSVRFNYLHFTSAPLNKSSWGTLPYVNYIDKSDSNKALYESYYQRTYSWPLTSSNTLVNTNFASYDYNRADSKGWGAVDFYLPTNLEAPNLEGTGTTWKSCYSFFYSVSFEYKNTDIPAYPEMAIAFYGKSNISNTYADSYVYHGRWQKIGYVDFVQSTTSSSDEKDFDSYFKGGYRLQYPECGQIELEQYPLKTIEYVRIYFDETKYEISSSYLRYGMNTDGMTESHVSNSSLLFSQSKSLQALGSYSTNLSSYYYTTDWTSDRGGIIDSDSMRYVTEAFGAHSVTKSFKLNQRPYMYYSMECLNGAEGTFELAFSLDSKPDETYYIYRDGSETVGDNLLRLKSEDFPGVSIDIDTDINSDHYIPFTENGCIDLRGFLIRKGIISEEDDVTITLVDRKIYVGDADSSVEKGIRFNYFYFDGPIETTIDLLPDKSGGFLEDGTATRTWVYSYGDNEVYGELEQVVGERSSEWDSYDQDSLYTTVDCDHPSGKSKDLVSTTLEPPTSISHRSDTQDDNSDGFNDLFYQSENWSWFSINYAAVTSTSTHNSHFPNNDDKFDYNFGSTGNCQMAGLNIDLSKTPYLHFSFSQPEDSYTTFVLQANNASFNDSDVWNVPSNEVKPWITCYNTQSPAGQLMHIAPSSKSITYYKDIVMGYDNGTYASGDFSGVIDLRSWYTETNGFDLEMNLERIRFYTTDYYGTKADVKVNHFYLSSSSASSYSVTFDNNMPEEMQAEGHKRLSRTFQVLRNANKQYVSDSDVESFKYLDGYTFVGWYTDEDWEEYFDISSQPITENITLYAGWIKNSDVIENEVDLLWQAENESVVKTSGSEIGSWHLENDSLHIDNPSETECFTVSVPVDKAYSALELTSVYLGIDTSDTAKTYLGLDENDSLPDGLKIELNLKSLGSHHYDLIGYSFGEYFSTDNILEAAPYDRELPMYMHLSKLNLRPDLVVENPNGYVVAKSLNITLPPKCSIAVRYAFTAAPQHSSDIEVVAPQITGDILDLLDPGGDMGFIEQEKDIDYIYPEEKTDVYGRDNVSLSQAKLLSSSSGYVTLGGKYGLGENIGTINFLDDSGNTIDQYLYFSVNQDEESSTAFIIWAEIQYFDSTENKIKGSWCAKHATFYDYRNFGKENGKLLGSYDDLSNGDMPEDAYFSGSHSGYIYLNEWYEDALLDEAAATENDYVTGIKIIGFRLYSSESGTDATFNYLAVGGKDMAQGESFEKAHAVVLDSDQQEQKVVLSDLSLGQTVHLSLDQLSVCADAHIADKAFLGWSFTNANAEPVWWNPHASNAKEYDSTTNPDGAWSAEQVEGFVQNRRDVFYQFTDKTTVIYPVFGNKVSVDFGLLFDGNGSVTVTHSTLNENVSADKEYKSLTYGERVLLSATGTDFEGWYTESGQLLSTSKEYVCSLYTDSVIVAKFSSKTLTGPTQYTFVNDQYSTVWLERAKDQSCVAGTDFYLRSVNDGSIVRSFEAKSNVNDTEGTEDIICYWNIAEGQLIEAVAPTGYHWEMLKQDGSKACVSNTNCYRFIASVNMKLICTPDSICFDRPTGVIVNEYAFAYDRVDPLDIVKEHTATVTGQAFIAANETLVSCGIVLTDDPHVMVPSYGSPESNVIVAEAWNSTTGQFTVNVDCEAYVAQFIRGYAIVKNTISGEYSLRYSDFVTFAL